MALNVDNLAYSDVIMETRSAASTVDFCRRLGLLRGQVSCRRCRRQMAYDSDRGRWRCHRCRRSASDHNGTFFANVHLSKDTVMRFMYVWSRQYCRQVDFQHEFRITSGSTVVEWKNFMRDVCLGHFIMNPVVIGGVGHTVELVDCMRVRGNYHRGHRVRHPQWIFGAIDIETTEGLVIPAADSDAATLLPLIRQHILPGKINVHITIQFKVDGRPAGRN